MQGACIKNFHQWAEDGPEIRPELTRSGDAMQVTSQFIADLAELAQYFAVHAIS